MTRLAVLATLQADDGDAGMAPEAVYARLSAQGFPVGLPSIYKALSELTEAQLAEKHRHRAQGAAMYMLRRGELRSAHVVCVACGVVKNISDGSLREQVLDAASRHGFTAHEVSIVVRGTCSACQAAAVSAPAAR